MKRRLRGLRAVIVLGLAAGAVTAVHLAASPGIGPASADATTGTAGLFVPTQGSVLDTRTGIGGVSGPVAANTWYPVQVAGQAGVPTSGVSAVQVSVTVLSPAATGLVKVAANGSAVVPIAALTYTGGGGSISASSITALPADGKIRVLAQTSVTLLVHVQGYYTAGNGAPAPGGYVPVTPARLVDTRVGTGLPQARLATGSTTSVKVGGLVNVPVDASAVFLMLTAISTSSTAGYFSPYPTGTTRPPNVSLNYLANTATILGAAVDLGTGGQFDLWVGPAGPAIDVVVDVVGYYTATAGTGGAFTPAAARVYDSRLSPNVALPARSSRVVQVGGIAGVPLSDRLSAYAFSAQIVHSGSNAGSLAMGPGDQPSAVVAAVYFSASSNVRSSLVIVPPAEDGSVLLVNSSLDPIHVILDVEGWFSDIGPAVPFVSSAEYEEGAWAAASTGPGTFLLEPAEGPAPAVYRYALDGAPTATVAGPTGQLSLSPQGSGEHVLTVSAIDAAGTASDTYDYSFNIGSAPASPAAVTVVATTGVASITWTPSTDNGAPITSYHLTMRDETTGTVYDEGSCATCTQYVITALDPTHTYTASVAADSGAGEGPFQMSAPFTPDTGPPGDCPDDSGCIIKPVDTPAMTSMDNPGGGVFPQHLAADPDDYYTSTTEEVSDDSDPDAAQTNAIWSGYYLPNGYKRSNGYVYDTIKLAHYLLRCNRSGCVRVGQINLQVHEYINGGSSVKWMDQVNSDWVYGPRYYVEAEYQCARNISGREDRFCNTYSDKADGYDAEIVTAGVGRSDHHFDWWHSFGTARSVTKYQLLRLMVKWPDQNVVSRGGDGDYGTKLRMYDVRRDSSGKSKLAHISGTGW